MHLTKRGEYGLRAMINLGIALELGYERVPVSDLARCGNLPLKFVEQILAELRAAGYLDTKRGKFGGYFLKRPMREIRMGDLIRKIDGPLAPIGCASQTAYQPCTCPDEAHCGLRMLMIDVRNAIANILDRYTLGDVVEVTLRKIRRDGVPYYFLEQQVKAAAAVAASEAAAAVEAERPRKTSRKREAVNHADPAEGFLASLKL